MTRRILNGLAAVLLASVLVYVVARVPWRQSTRPARAGEAAPVMIRYAHDNIHESVRIALAKIKKDYERLHPGVIVEINEVPARVWNQWMRSQLVGGLAPDLMKAAISLSDADLALYFEPLTAAMAEPNPYNRGTPLEHVSWRDTFIDGLSNTQSFPPGLMEVYRVPFYGSTDRVFYNRALFKAATGREEPPATFDEFIATCAALRDYAEKQRLELVPIASATNADSAIPLFNRIFQQQTQRLARQVGTLKNLKMDQREAAIAYFRGQWRIDQSPAREALDLMREIGRNFQPAFLQARREDVTFLFSQQRAAMIVSGSWDASYFLNQLTFPVGVFSIPLPTPDHPLYGAGVLGAIAEGDESGTGAFGLVRGSPHREQTLDFLRYITSVKVNEEYAATIQRVPAVLQAGIAPEIAAFAPNLSGWRGGFSPDFSEFGGKWVRRAFLVHLHDLLAEHGSVDTFLANYTDAFDRALRQDAQFHLTNARRTAQRSDSVIVALAQLGLAGDADAAARGDRMMEAQNLQEAGAAQLAWVLATEGQDGR